MKAPSFDWLQGLALGLLIGVVAFCSVLWGIDTAPADHFHGYIIAALTVGGTVLAAWIALRSVQAQVRSSIELAESARQRELRASAAMLPLALSRIIAVCEHNIRRHFETGQLLGEGRQFGGELQTIDADALHAIRDCIAHVEGGTHQHLLYLFRAYQVLLARDRDIAAYFLIPGGRDETNYEFEMRASDAINWAALHAAASGAFGFARGETNSIDAYDPEGARSAFIQAGITLEANPLVRRKFDVRLDGGRLGLKFVTSGASQSQENT